MPGVKKISVTPSTSGFGKFLMPRGADATSNPFTGNMTYNPDMMGQRSQFDKEQTMTHELTHTGQTQNNVPWHKLLTAIFERDEKVPAGVGSNVNNPYFWRSNELEAFQAERNRAARLKTPNYADPITGKRDKVLNTGPTTSKLKKLQGG